MFTRIKDYDTAIESDDLEVLIEDDCNLLRQIEASTQSQIKTFLAHRYDVDEMFKGFTKWDATKTYQIDDLVVFPENEDQLFIGLVADNLNNTPIPDNSTNEWLKADNRHQYLLMIFKDMVLFHAHRTIDGRKIPEHRISLYDDAIKWFEDINAEKITPNFPRLSPTDPAAGRTNIRHGVSNRNNTNTY